MKRPRISEVYFWFFGHVLCSAAIALIVRANVGVTAMFSFPYVLNQKLPQLTLGVWSYLLQGVIMLVLIAILRRVKLVYLLSFAVSVGFGYMLDFFHGLFAALPDGLWQRVTYFFAGLFIIWIGIGAFMSCGLPLMPYDIFVRDLVVYKGFKLHWFKTAMDLGFVVLTSVLSLLFFAEIRGVGVGTIASAALIGTGAGFFRGLLTRTFELVPLAPRGAKPDAQS